MNYIEKVIHLKSSPLYTIEAGISRARETLIEFEESTTHLATMSNVA